MNRRQFLSLITAISGTPLVAQCMSSVGGPGHSSHRLTPTAQPNRITSTDGLLELTLTAQKSPQQIDRNNVQLLAYNGSVPGPTLEARAGDTVRLTLHNRLDSPTNLHYHGLHISPKIDNVFREVASGEQYTYEFQIPQNHPAITGWYHPHYHLNVAPQVSAGLAGALLIRGELDDIPELRQAEEALLVLQDFDVGASADRPEPHPLGKKWGREGSLLTANGQRNPVVDIPHNGLLRLRLINASASRIYQLQLRDHPWFLIATDRGSIDEPLELDTLLLSPGERAELLIPGQREVGDYSLVSLPYDRGIGDMISTLGDQVEQMSGVVKPMEMAIATFRYQARDISTPLPLPRQLIVVEPLPTPDTTREFVLDHGLDATAASTGFTINGQSFVMNRVNTHVRLNHVEEWQIINKASMDHPFHLHTNRFQVIERNGQPEFLRAWKDTVNIAAYETVTMRVRFEDFVGRTVYHCHILDHEDQGMMGIVDIS